MVDGEGRIFERWPGSSPVPIPERCYLQGDEVEYFGMRGDRKVWRHRAEKRYYTWDSLHGHIEAYDKRGRHVAVLDAFTGRKIDTAEPGRSIDV